MYPNLYYAFKDIFGVEWQWLRFINSFGFFVAIAFLVGAYILVRELKRRERAGLLHHSEVKVTIGKPASIIELLTNAVLGFVLGFKFVGLLTSDSSVTSDPQEYMFSTKGNLLAGIALALFFAGLKWWEKNKAKLEKPEDRVVRIWPHDRVGDIVIYAALFGFLGAKIFHNLENWDEFWKNPIEALLSFSGLTFYGGLICAAIAIFIYARRHKIGFRHLCDTMAPTLMIAYAIGRIGCQVSGDGDWGVLNSAYVFSPQEQAVVEADSSQFRMSLELNSGFYKREFKTDDLSTVPHHTVKAPSWLPEWTVAYTYPHNVINQGIGIKGCKDGEQYCYRLPGPVFPTPFYETLICLGLFIFIWSVRKKFKVPGTLFAVYLVVNGLERFFIEKIRVNTTYSIMGFHPTQAEIISAGLVIAGVILYLVLNARKKSIAKAK